MQIRKYAILGLFAAILLYVPSSGFANAESVPNWVKTNAGWWASGDIDQQSFIQGIEYLVNQGIISVPVQKVSGEKSETVPDWNRDYSLVNQIFNSLNKRLLINISTCPPTCVSLNPVWNRFCVCRT